VVLDGEIIGKPASGPEARRILRGLSGRTHTVLTAVALVRAAADGSLGHRAVRVESTRVTFARVEPAQLDAYVASREPEGKAGAYALQGLGAALVESIEGDPTTVIGLPLRTTALMLAEAGHDPWPGTRAAGAPLSW
jgi:septum formation protein